jgi:glycosyltransferase involved in cell wall biosynthesis
MNALVIIPCHNEELSIAATIKSVRRSIENPAIWIIDNLSTDLTAKIASDLGATVLCSPQPGKGYAVRHAFNRINSDFDVVIMIDGDDTYGTQSFKTGIDLVLGKGFDMVVGNRVMVESNDGTRSPAFRAGHGPGNFLLSKLFKILFGVEIVDTLSGWRVLSLGFVKSFTGGATEFEIEAELNVHAYTLKSPVTSIPITYSGRHIGSSSKLRTYRDGLKIFKKQLQLFRSERPLIAYSCLGVPWLVSSILLLTKVLTNYFATQLVLKFPSLIAAVGCFIVASLFWVTGMILEKVRLIRVAQARSIYSMFAR